jgi:heat shock protein 5
MMSDSAKNAYHSNPANTVFEAKCLIGRKMDEAELKKDMKHWPFGVVNNLPSSLPSRTRSANL